MSILWNMDIKLFNTLGKKEQILTPIEPNSVSLYTCGPTVYDFAHIGNLRTYIFEDILRRVIEYNGLKLTHAMNITDVGHLVGDADHGEDKLEVGAKREGKHPLEIAKFYENKFFEDCKTLNILPPHKLLRATDSIPEQIEIIKILDEKGFVYKDDLAVYFDTSKLEDYGKLSGQKLSEKLTGAREEVVIDTRKKNPQDFVLWFFLKGKYENHILKWPSPWGEGFPGWHIECSAISKKLLGQPFDIHTGGVDHIGTHHTNEIAQSEAAFNAPLANIWMHGEFLLINGGRMGKSQGNLLTLDSLQEFGIDPLSYRYLCLTAHYRTQLNFTPENLKAAKSALNRLYNFIEETKDELEAEPLQQTLEEFNKHINNDLDLPGAVAVMWKMLSSDETKSQKKATLFKLDEVLGLNLKTPPEIKIPAEVSIILGDRLKARQEKNFKKSDELREKIKELGFDILDTKDGQKVIRS